MLSVSPFVIFRLRLFPLYLSVTLRLFVPLFVLLSFFLSLYHCFFFSFFFFLSFFVIFVPSLRLCPLIYLSLSLSLTLRPSLSRLVPASESNIFSSRRVMPLSIYPADGLLGVCVSLSITGLALLRFGRVTVVWIGRCHTRAGKKVIYCALVFFMCCFSSVFIFCVKLGSVCVWLFNFLCCLLFVDLCFLLLQFVVINFIYFVLFPFIQFFYFLAIFLFYLKLLS